MAEDQDEYRSTSELVDALVHHALVLRALGRIWPSNAAARRMIAVSVAHLVATPPAQDANGELLGYWILRNGGGISGARCAGGGR